MSKQIKDVKIINIIELDFEDLVSIMKKNHAYVYCCNANDSIQITLHKDEHAHDLNDALQKVADYWDEP